jgi:hypothetical protein
MVEPFAGSSGTDFAIWAKPIWWHLRDGVVDSCIEGFYLIL